MLSARTARLIVFAAALFCLIASRAQLVVYDNTAQSTGFIYPTTHEYGDQVTLAGNARVVTKISFEYKGDFIPDGDESAILRFYANLGPGWSNRTDFPTPAPLLWQSDPITIRPNFNTVNLPVPNIKVPKTFTWTVQFLGLSMQSGVVHNSVLTNDTAGLLFYGTPTNTATIGSGFNDFWESFPSGWTPSQIPGVPRNDFGARITAIPETIVPKVTASFYSGHRFILLSWPVTDIPYVLQGKAHWTNQWTDVTAPPTRIGDTYQRVLEFGKFGVFRLRQSTAPTSPSLQIIRDDKNMRLRWPTNAPSYVLQTKTLLTPFDWIDLPTPAIPTTNGYYEVVQRGTAITQIYRLRQSDFAEPAP